MLDFHTHILPGMDDGSKNIEESLAILKTQYQKGIKGCILSSHFYPEDDKAVFVHKGREGKKALEKSLQEAGLLEMKLYTGAEVLLSVDTPKLEKIEELCFSGTSYILLEMPYSHWSNWIYDTVEELISIHRVRPIIAHVERYDAVMNSPNALLPFLEMGALLQLNSYSLMKRSSRHKLSHSLIKHGMIHLLGSDVHHRGNFVTVADAYKEIESKHGRERAIWMKEIGEKVVLNQEVMVEGYKPFKKFLGKWY